MVRANSLNSVAQQLVYVNAQTGSDTAGNGSVMNPYATLGKANTSITDNAQTKVYTVILTGVTTETTVVFKPFINYSGYGYTASKIIASGGVSLDSSWNTATNPNSLITNISLPGTTNFSATLTGTTSNATLSWQNCLIEGDISFTGRATKFDSIFFQNMSLNGSTGTFTDCNVTSICGQYGGNYSFVSTSSTAPRTWLSQADQFLNDVDVSETSGQDIMFQIQQGVILGSLNVTGATASGQYDAISRPQAQVTLMSGATVSQFISSPGVIPLTSVTGATYTLIGSDYYLACNRAGAIALTFPGATGSGRVITIKDVSGAAGTNNITATSSGSTFDGQSTLTINSNYGGLTVTDTATDVWSKT